MTKANNKEKRENLLKRIIMLYGFEHKKTLEFCSKIDDPNYKTFALALMVAREERLARW